MIHLFFFASGFSALAYQIVWTRAAGLALGNSAEAVGTVVAVFMGGLALGSAAAGRIAARVRPLRLYGQLEIAIGLLGLAVPWLLKASAPLQAMAYDTALFPLVRVLTCALLLLPATTLMGATLPLLVQHVSRPEAAGRLYAANSAGAALGALAAGLVLVPLLGLLVTTLVAVFINFAVGVACIRLGGTLAAPPQPAPLPAEPLTRLQKVALAVYALSGFVALVYEMAWTRALTLAVGATVYAFALILFSFIIGLALGSWLSARRSAGMKDPLRAAAVLQLAIAAWSAALVWFLADLPLRAAQLVFAGEGSFWRVEVYQSLMIAALVVPPTALMGALLPVVASAFRAEGPEAGRSIGRVYAWNTVAAIAGSAAGTFLLIPLLGIDLTLRAATVLNLATGGLALAVAAPSPARGKAGLGVAALGVVAALCLLPAWETSITASGALHQASHVVRRTEEQGGSLEEMVRRDKVEAAYWDATGLITVHRVPEGQRFLRINGKTDAGTDRSDMATQGLLGQIPMLLHEDPRRVLVVGLGIGITLASVQAHDPQRVDCVEISPGVVRAAGLFSDVNGGALSRPGTRIVVNDARAHVRYSDARYDVVVSEPSNLWVSGMANLFTADFFREVRDRLETGGVFAQWLHCYRLSTDDFRGVLRTFTEVFPETQLWEMDPLRDYLLVGSVERRRCRIDRLRERVRRPEVARRLAQAGIRDETEFLASYLFGPADAADAARGGRLITDDRCWVEYTAPMSLYRSSVAAIQAILEPRRRSARDILDPEGGGEESARALDRFAAARRPLSHAILALRGHAPRSSLAARIDEALEAHPGDPRALEIARQVARAEYRAAFQLQQERRYPEALARLAAVPARSPLHPEALSLAGWCLFCQRDLDGARARYEAARAARARFVEAHVGLSQVVEEQGRLDEARALLEEAAGWDPKASEARLALARFLGRRGEKAKAREWVGQVLADHPNDPEALRLREQFRGD